MSRVLWKRPDTRSSVPDCAVCNQRLHPACPLQGRKQSGWTGQVSIGVSGREFRNVRNFRDKLCSLSATLPISKKLNTHTPIYLFSFSLSQAVKKMTVVDAIGHPRSESMHITERYRRRDFGHMDLEITFNDPKYYTRPFSIKTVDISTRRRSF